LLLLCSCGWTSSSALLLKLYRRRTTRFRHRAARAVATPPPLYLSAILCPLFFAPPSSVRHPLSPSPAARCSVCPPSPTDESLDKSKVWKLMEITESAQYRSIKLVDNNNMRPSKVVLCVSFFPSSYLQNLYHLQFCAQS
jgi:hypothetical protein